MGGGSNKSSTQPWGPQGAAFQDLYGRAQGVLDTQLNYFPGSTVADRNPWEIQANINVADIVNNQGGVTQSAAAENLRTTSGEYLDVNSNPFLRQFGDAAAEDISRVYNRTTSANIASRFGGAGRSAGPRDSQNAEGNAQSAAQRDLGQELSQMYAGLYGGAYESERGRMQQASLGAGGIRDMQFRDQAALQAAGRDEFAYAQMQLSDIVNRFNFQQYEPFERLGMFQSLISQPGGYGVSQSSGTLGGAQIGGMIGSVAASALGSFFGNA